MTTGKKVLLVVMDGVGVSANTFGNAVLAAKTPIMQGLKRDGLYTELAAHGLAVGLPSDTDLGNSEVGHNALGAGRTFNQGAKLVQDAIASGAMFRDNTWRHVITAVKQAKSTLHFLGLLSDGNVHSHENHLYAMLRQAKVDGVSRVRVHALLDGRDVGEKTAEIYASRLEKVIGELRSPSFDIAVASGGGRMTITMDRYEADWSMVERGWNTHVHGRGPIYPSLLDALAALRKQTELGDQYLPEFVIGESGKPNGKIVTGDGVIFFNYRGDRAIEISKAFADDVFAAFDRGLRPKVTYAGMMQYDGDALIPKDFLVSPPVIQGTLSEYLIGQGARQFACSETQKYGHMTYFWNGNRSGYLDKTKEEYLEIPSDGNVTFDIRPWMKAQEIAAATMDRMQRGAFDFGRINFANGDMVGHTGNFEAAVIAVATVDLMLGMLQRKARETNTILVVTADHGNCDEMFDAKAKDFPDWEALPLAKRPRPKTSHTLAPVPFFVFDPNGANWALAGVPKPGLANVANTVLALMGLPVNKDFMPSLVRSK